MRNDAEPFSNLNFFVKNRQNFFRDLINEYSLIQSQKIRILHFFLRIVDEFFPGFRAKFQKRVIWNGKMSKKDGKHLAKIQQNSNKFFGFLKYKIKFNQQNSANLNENFEIREPLG